MRRPLRLVHTADVHLGEQPNPFLGAASGDRSGTPPEWDRRVNGAGVGRDSTARPALARTSEIAFTRVVDTALAERADALLIAGDLFDSNRVSEPAVRFAQAQLRRLSCPVVLIPGNHDCYDETSIYRRFDFRDIGPHMHPLYAEEGELVTFDGLGLTVWGKGLVEHAPANRPLHGVPSRAAEHWFVGLAHGHFALDRRELRSSLITPDEIARCGLDYLALGHVHVFRDVSQGPVRACYPGAPRIPYAQERGGVAIIQLDPAGGVSVEERRL
ncbi:MAG TPA: DNA repair exonuclease [Thermoanaerobaculia bacterium]|nr:DNA repair exonuclease [Thermoanaerobaculia bacterium]